MTIRRGKATDAPAVVALVEATKERSCYAGYRLMKQNLIDCVKGAAYRGNIWIAENQAGVPTGCLIGATERLYDMFRERVAFDAVFCFEPGHGFADQVEIVNAFVQWAWTQPGVVEIQSRTGAVDGWEGIGRFLQGLGFEPSGEIYRMRKEAA